AYMVDATTDDQGRWRCRCFRKMTWAYLYLSHPDYLSDGEWHPRPHGESEPSRTPRPDNQPFEGLRDFSDVQVMKRGVAIAGRVVGKAGMPVPGAEVGWLEAERTETFHSDMPTTSTDAKGGFRFPNVRPGRIVLLASARGNAPELKALTAKEGVEPI